ncbi:MAG: RNA polymerase sigma factor [Flavobacteriales bacterium]|nr:RNA polymerase sigma factor [Flavobacteriales bacterium]
MVEGANEEKKLISRIVGGETQLFAKIVDAHKSRVAVCFKMLKDDLLAEEVGHETFVRLYKSLHKFKHESSLATYLTRIAMNLCLNKLEQIKRNQSRYVELDDAPKNVYDTAKNIQTALGIKQTVERCLDVLKPEAKAVVVMRMIEGYSVKETADILGMAEGTVMSKLSRAMEKMKEVLIKLNYNG